MYFLSLYNNEEINDVFSTYQTIEAEILENLERCLVKSDHRMYAKRNHYKKLVQK